MVEKIRSGIFPEMNMEGDNSSQAESSGTQTDQTESTVNLPVESTLDNIKDAISKACALPAKLFGEQERVNWFGEGSSIAKDRL